MKKTVDTSELMTALSAIMGEKDAPTGTPSTPYYHGPNGIFGMYGLERSLISTRVQPMGFADQIPVVASTDMNPMFGYITGFRAGTGARPTNVCDNSPTPGPIKTCVQTAQFGRWSMSTRELELTRIGQSINRAEFFDLQILNDPLVTAMGGIFPDMPSETAMLLGREIVARMIELGVSLQEWISSVLYTGNPANNTVGGGYMEFPGLDILIGTTKVDALTGQSCPSLASYIYNFGYRMANDTGMNPTIVHVVTNALRQVKHNASRMNFGSTVWAIVMRENLFYELTNVWPCVYSTSGCLVPSGVDNNVDVMYNLQFRDAMRVGQYLLVDGMQVPVIFDDAIFEDTPTDNATIKPGQYASDIYIIPMTVRGGTPVTFWQTFDYSKGVAPGISDGKLSNIFWTDAGRYLWNYDFKNTCIIHTCRFQPRLILLTPHLACRITNVKYQPIEHTRDSLITQPYFTDGGVFYRQAPKFYSDWNPTTPA